MLKHSAKQDLIAIAILIVFSIGMFFIPNAERLASQSGVRTRAVVTEVDNSNLSLHGLLKYGEQNIIAQVSEGKFKGTLPEALQITKTLTFTSHLGSGSVHLFKDILLCSKRM